MTPKSDEQPGQSGQAMNGLLAVNQLNYSLPSDLSVVTSNMVTVQYPLQRTASAGQTIVFTLNTGSSYVNGMTSSLVLTVRNDSATATTLGLPSSTIAAIIQRLSIYTRSGQLIEVIDNVNMLSNIRTNYEHSKDWINTVGAFAGYGDTIAQGETKKFVLPLCEISGLFGYDKGFLPNMLMSGLRIELLLDSAANAFTSSSGAAISYSVDDVTILADAYQITDSVIRQLNAQSSNSGLEVYFNTWFTTIATRPTDNINLQIMKSVSRALNVVMKERVPRANTVSELQADPFRSPVITNTEGPKSSQVRIGSLYKPLQPVQGSNPLIWSPEGAMHTAQCFKRYDRKDLTSNPVSPAIWRNGQHVIGFDLERTAGPSISALPLSNSRILEISAKYADTPASPNNINAFLCHVVLVRCYLSNQTVESWRTNSRL